MPRRSSGRVQAPFKDVIGVVCQSEAGFVIY